MRYWFIALLLMVLTGCVKSLGNDERLDVNFSFHERGFGASNQELLKDDKFRSLKIEVQYMKGFKPDDDAIINMRKFLLQHLHKPKGISVATKQIDPDAKRVLNLKDVKAIEKGHRSMYSYGDEITIYILYTNGEFENRKILGQAYKNTSIVMYGKAIQKNSGTFRKRTRTDLETTILLHEMGHLLGLAKEGTLMYTNHIDSNHKSHCEDTTCLMYYGIDISEKAGPVIRRGVPQLDKECLFDLVANGGK
jgi:hypothetical protein